MSDFTFHRLRFTYVARAPLRFPADKPANLLRGALGVVFRQLVCSPDCPGAKQCPRRGDCPYARAFEPVAQGSGPSGLADWPRPFVFRARHLDGRSFQPGETFFFDLHVFSADPELHAGFVRTFEEIGRQGLGPTRARADLTAAENTPLTIALTPAESAPTRIHIHFLTPTELKAGQRLITRPDFGVLFARIRDRISTLSALYGPGPLAIDFTAMATRASGVRTVTCDIRQVHVDRRSSRTGQTHSLGGFVGTAEYEGELAEFLPYLQAACVTGVGRQTVWGKGEIAIR